MELFVINIIKRGSVSFVAQKAFRCLGKKDYADIVAFAGIVSVSAEIISLALYLGMCFNNWWGGLMDSPVMKFFFG